ncbi:MAG: biotin--[acetyl-CoA-carboxylase] ligase [Thermodesulfovibrionales bacterium]
MQNMIPREALERALAGSPFERFIICDEVDSTNLVARGLRGEYPKQGIVVLADSQRKGRGRHGREWHSPPGENVYMSLLLMPECKAADTPFLAILAAIGVCEALRRSSGLDIRIKWPNDILVNMRKLCGILTEVQTVQGIATSAIIGIGLNVNSSTQTMPREIRDTATSLKDELGSGPVAREAIVVAVLREIGSLYQRLFPRMGTKPPREADAEEKALMIRRWTKLDVTLGRRIHVRTASGTVRGTALLLDDNGLLHVQTDSGAVEKMSTGDICLVE